MIEPLRIPAGAELYIGAPANPLPATVVEGLRSLLLGVAEIEEAHLPQMYVPAAMTDAAQVLVVVVAPRDQGGAIETIGRALPSILPAGTMLDVWPLPADHELLNTVRAARCELKTARRTTFWRAWFGRPAG